MWELLPVGAKATKCVRDLVKDSRERVSMWSASVSCALHFLPGFLLPHFFLSCALALRRKPSVNTSQSLVFPLSPGGLVTISLLWRIKIVLMSNEVPSREYIGVGHWKWDGACGKNTNLEEGPFLCIWCAWRKLGIMLMVDVVPGWREEFTSAEGLCNNTSNWEVCS